MNEFIVEADGGSRGNPGPAGYGAVVLDAATGQTLAEAAEYLGVATNNVAEYRGLIAGLRAAHRLDPEASVRVRMDSRLVVEQMSGRWQIKHPGMRPLAAEARAVFPPGQVAYEWIPRARNTHADRLANEAMDAGKRGERWSPADSTAALDARPTPSEAADRNAAENLARGAAGTAPDPDGSEDRSGGRDPDGGKDRSASRNLDGGKDPDGGQDLDRAGSASPAEDLSTAPAAAAATSTAPAGSRAPADLGTPTTFVLLRHGETALTPQKRFSGSGGSDPALSAAGREQARRAAAALAARGTVQAVVSSPLARCRETAQAAADRLGLPVTVEEGLRETDFGAWEGLTFGEVRARHPEDLAAWLGSPGAEPTGGGESFEAVAVRVEAARQRLLAAHAGRTVLLVSHVTPIKTLVRLALAAPAESLFRMELSAASLSALAYYADGNASLRLLNDTGHLRC
ncbi:bifunctional RNase H/acid phosphatase [Streptomyces albus]|uniref:Bifunctional RNase H/acid phosphatase n=1 Tax=Streptomyces albus (strain ATCC 21838 / DSM 41398 / FERM P-419 / JCM 4703 / NBRC 107858) TaxID=1081613 RepID=A0A0B5ESY8_STRA4|nr:bifunctional RNase H/acid phosphatase [Streptomyces albus]AOU80226.1 bifunctional RNase H/acid phosphatase [Streptomyces albus]AYN35941.1 bifunctional RNase H/acid phosphatase [Streptomyces albus]